MNVGNSIFFHYSNIHIVEENLTQEEITHRIEGHVLNFLKYAVKEQVHSFVRPAATQNNLESRNGIKYIGLQKQEIRSYTSKNTQIWHCLSLVHKNLLEKQTFYLRELYYHVKPLDIFQNSGQSITNSRLADVPAILGCPRSALGVKCSSKGLVQGEFSILMDDNTWMNCNSQVLTLSDSLVMDLKDEKISCTAKYIIVIVFRKLIESYEIISSLHVVLVCGSGNPSFTTRRFIRLLQQKNNIKTLGLFDYNPGGYSIFLTYASGSITSGVESYRNVIDIHFLGLMRSHLSELEIPSFYIQPMTSHDFRTITSLRENHFIQLNPSLIKEVEEMNNFKSKLELDVIDDYYGSGSLAQFVTHRGIIAGISTRF